jgi:predicted ATPase
MALLRQEFDKCLPNNSDANNDNNNEAASRIIFLSGPGGRDKQALVRQAWQSHVGEKGYFAAGSFDGLSNAGMTPYEGFVMAFAELVLTIQQDGEKEVQEVAEALEASLGDQKWVLATMIPSLRTICQYTEENSTANAPSGGLNEQAGTRFSFALRTTLRDLCCKEYPLVLFLDNIECADAGSLDLLYSIAMDKESQGLVLVCASSDDTAGPQSCLPESVRQDTDDKEITIVNVAVSNWDESAIKTMLNETLILDDADCTQLARMVYDNTEGNVLHVFQFLDWLEYQEILFINPVSGTATLNACHEDFNQCPISCQSLLTERLVRLSPSVRDVLKVASCLGTEFNNRLIQCVLGVNVANTLDELVRFGLLADGTMDSTYSFVDVLVRRAAYFELTNQDQRGRLHLEVGRRIWRKLSQAELEQYVFLVLSQFQAAKHLIRREEEQVAIATLCLHGGLKAGKASAFLVAAKHLELGLFVINSTDPRNWRNKHDLMLALHNAAGEMHMCTANLERMDEVLAAVFNHARDDTDKVQAFITRIGALSYSERKNEAIDLGVQVLKSLGEYFPRRLCGPALLAEYKSVKKLLKGKTDEQLLRLPLISDETKLQCLQILNVMVLPCLLQRPKFTPFVMLKIMKLTLQHGLSALAAPAFAIYGMLCIAAVNDFDSAQRYADLSLALLDHFKSIEYLPRIAASIYGCVLPWSRPLREMTEPLLKAHQVGLGTGDIEFSSLCANIYIFYGMDTGEPLQQLDMRWKAFRGIMVLHRQGDSLRMLLPVVQMVHHLMGLTDDPLSSRGDIADFDELYEDAVSKDYMPATLTIKECRMLLHYLLNDYEGASRFVISRAELAQAPPSIGKTTDLFYITLTRIANARLGIKARKNLAEAKKCLRSLRFWAQHCPENFINKILLVEAELASVQQKNLRAREKFVCAISLARTQGFTQDVALAYELFARHQFALQERKEAKSNFESACEYYEMWGALAKLRQLRKHMESIGL